MYFLWFQKLIWFFSEQILPPCAQHHSWGDYSGLQLQVKRMLTHHSPCWELNTPTTGLLVYGLDAQRVWATLKLSFYCFLSYFTFNFIFRNSVVFCSSIFHCSRFKHSPSLLFFWLGRGVNLSECIQDKRSNWAFLFNADQLELQKNWIFPLKRNWTSCLQFYVISQVLYQTCCS